MKNILNVIAVLIILSGGIWILQGTGILGGNLMSNNPQWTINGVITIIIGAGIFWFANRK